MHAGSHRHAATRLRPFAPPAQRPQAKRKGPSLTMNFNEALDPEHEDKSLK